MTGPTAHVFSGVLTADFLGALMDRRATVFHTLGCRLNAYETEAMKRELPPPPG
jgi:hypothetical protein